MQALKKKKRKKETPQFASKSLVWRLDSYFCSYIWIIVIVSEIIDRHNDQETFIPWKHIRCKGADILVFQGVERLSIIEITKVNRRDEGIGLPLFILCFQGGQIPFWKFLQEARAPNPQPPSSVVSAYDLIFNLLIVWDSRFRIWKLCKTQVALFLFEFSRKNIFL